MMLHEEVQVTTKVNGAGPFLSTAILGNTEACDVLVIHCSAPEFQAPFDDYCANGLGGRSYARIALPGGAEFVSCAVAPKFEWAGLRWTRFMTRQKRVSEVIMIGHEGCSWYAELMVGKPTVAQVSERIIADMKRQQALLTDFLGRVAVHAVFARSNSTGRVAFSNIQ